MCHMSPALPTFLAYTYVEASRGAKEKKTIEKIARQWHKHNHGQQTLLQEVKVNAMYIWSGINRMDIPI